MNTAFEKEYHARLGTLDGALDLIRSGDTIATPIYGCEPSVFLKNLHRIGPHVENVSLWTMLMMGDYPVMTDNSLKGHIDIYSFFYCKEARSGHSTGRFSMTPLDLHAVGDVVTHTKRPNVFVGAVSPMDEHGYVYMSFDLQDTLECMETADTVIFEINKNIPRIFGETAIPITAADYIYETEYEIPRAPLPPESDVDKQIAQNVVSLINDGDCIQLGIGGMPNAVGEALLDHKDLGIHTEMITSSMGKLLRAGVVTNERKNFNRGKTIGAFAWGDQPLYDYMEENTSICMRRAAYVNNPFNIARNDNMVSVNTAIQIDLTGQICSESMGSLQYSGTGGASDFAYGAFHSKGGKGIIAFPSTAKHGTISKIQAQLTPGAVVSISRNIADYVVTEYGIAHLKNHTIRERVEQLINIAHPDFRSDLRRQANKLMLW